MPENPLPCGRGSEFARGNVRPQPSRDRKGADKLLAFLLLGPAYLAAQAPESILGPSILVFGAYKDNNDVKFASRGGAFVIDARHVVTSLTQCCGKTKEGIQLIPAVIAGENAQPGKVLWSSQDMDLAIVEVEQDLNRPGVAIIPAKLVRQGQPVYLVNYPNSPKEKPRIAQGQIEGTAKIEDGAELFRSNVPLTPTNAGGALFDGCGNAIASNFVARDGATYSVTGDPIISALESIGVQARIANEACGAGGARSEPVKGAPTKSDEQEEKPQNPNAWRMPQGTEWIALILILGVAALAFRPASRRQVAQVLTGRHRLPGPPPPPHPYQQAPPNQQAPLPPMPVTAKPVLRGVAGQYAGASIGLDPLQSTLGRDPSLANLVFAADAGTVSKRHCTVRWDSARRTFVLEDHGSTNGTFLATGERLLPNQPRELRPGERFYIGDLRNQFEVAME